MASFTITSDSFTANHDGFPCGFNLAHASVPAGFWTDVDEDGGNIRVFSGATRLPAHVTRFDKTNETGWLWFRSDVLTGSDNEFTVDTDGTPFSPASDVSLTVTNPGAETGDATGWTATTGSISAREDTGAAGDIAPHSGTFYFYGGTNALTVAHQDIAIPGAQESDVDAGTLAAKLTYWVGSDPGDADSSAMEVEFYDGGASQIGDTVAHSQADGPEAWELRTLRTPAPPNTRTVRIIQRFVRTAGSQANGYIDDISLDLVDVDPNGPEKAWEDYQAVYFLGESPRDYTGKQADITVDQGRPEFFEFIEESPQINAHDGVATDGTFYYCFDSAAIRKFDLSWNSVATNASIGSGAGNPGIDSLGGGAHNDGKLYIAAGVSGTQYLGVYDASDLSFIEAFDISGFAQSAADFYYNTDDGLLYTIRFQTGGADSIIKIDPVDGSNEGSITLSTSITHAQGIVLFRGAFWVSVGDASVSDRVFRVELDGTVTPTPNGMWHAAVTGNIQGMDVSPDGAGIIIVSNEDADRVETWRPRDIDMGGGGGVYVDDDRMWTDLSSGGATVFTMACTVLVEDWTDNRAVMRYMEELGTTSDRASIGARSDTEVWQFFDSVNSDVPGTSSVTLDQIYRIAGVWDGASSKRVYVDGALDAEDLTVSAIPTTCGILLLGNSGIASGDHKGLIGFAYMRYEALSSEWFADEHSLLDDNAAFWSVAAAGGPTTKTIGVQFAAFVKDTGPPPKENAIGVSFNAFVTTSPGADDPKLGGTGRNLLKRFSGRHIGKPVGPPPPST